MPEKVTVPFKCPCCNTEYYITVVHSELTRIDTIDIGSIQVIYDKKVL